MKKIKMMIVALVATVLMLPAVASTDVGLVAVRGNDWRYGVAIPVMHLTDKVSLDFWTLTDSNFGDLYLGGGASVPIYKTDRITFAATFGWSADMSDLHNITKGEAAIGLRFTLRL